MKKAKYRVAFVCFQCILLCYLCLYVVPVYWAMTWGEQHYVIYAMFVGSCGRNRVLSATRLI